MATCTTLQLPSSSGDHDLDGSPCPRDIGPTCNDLASRTSSLSVSRPLTFPARPPFHLQLPTSLPWLLILSLSLYIRFFVLLCPFAAFCSVP